MNTKPDDELLALWVEDELDGPAAREVDAWASTQPEWIERRELARWSRSLLGGALATDEDIPHAEFFNARIRREVEIQGQVREQPVAPAKVRRGPWPWLMPATAAAGVMLGFWLGHDRGSSAGVAAPVAELEPVLYTPEKGVQAKYVRGDETAVIVLAGVDAIPDSWEIPATAMVEPEPSRIVSTSFSR